MTSMHFLIAASLAIGLAIAGPAIAQPSPLNARSGSEETMRPPDVPEEAPRTPSSPPVPPPTPAGLPPAPPPIAPPPPLTGDDALRAKVMAFLAVEIEQAKATNDQEAKISINLVDLNRDGTPEALVIVNHPNLCVVDIGCTAYVLDLTGETARSLGDLVGRRLEVANTTTAGWRDLKLNGVTMRLRNGVYVKK